MPNTERRQCWYCPKGGDRVVAQVEGAGLFLLVCEYHLRLLLESGGHDSQVSVRLVESYEDLREVAQVHPDTRIMAEVGIPTHA